MTIQDKLETAWKNGVKDIVITYDELVELINTISTRSFYMPSTDYDTIFYRNIYGTYRDTLTIHSGSNIGQ
jgi:hypothetical protein